MINRDALDMTDDSHRRYVAEIAREAFKPFRERALTDKQADDFANNLNALAALNRTFSVNVMSDLELMASCLASASPYCNHEMIQAFKTRAADG